MALEPQRLVVRDLGAEDVARARLPLAVGRGRLPRALLVDRHLALELHVVEDDHLLPADDGDLAASCAGRARRGACARSCPTGSAGSRRRRPRRLGVRNEFPCAQASDGLLVEQVEDHREVVDAERPERVLVACGSCRGSGGSSRRRAPRRGRRSRPGASRADRGVVEQQVARHQHEPSLLGQLARALPSRPRSSRAASRRSTCLPGLERALGELVMGRHRRRDHDRLELRVGEERRRSLVGDSRLRIAGGEAS